MLRSTIFILGLLAATNGLSLLPNIQVSTGPLLAPLETAANSALSSVSSAASSVTSSVVSLPQQFQEAFTPPQVPGMPSMPGMPPLNPMTPLRPGLILHHLFKKFIMAAIRLLKTILHRIQDWVLRTSDYLELLEARNIFGPFFNRLLHRLIVWMRSFVSQEHECIGRVLCEISDQASAFLPASLKQVLLIYFSANQEASFYYQPLANGFVSQGNSCARLYSSCDQARFLRTIEHMNVTVPQFYEKEEEELAAEMESSHNELVSSFGRSVEPLPTPMAEKALPAAVPEAPEAVPEKNNVVNQVVNVVNVVAPKPGKV